MGGGDDSSVLEFARHRVRRSSRVTAGEVNALAKAVFTVPISYGSRNTRKAQIRMTKFLRWLMAVTSVMEADL
jgi:hypothetical protein